MNRRRRYRVVEVLRIVPQSSRYSKNEKNRCLNAFKNYHQTSKSGRNVNNSPSLDAYSSMFMKSLKRVFIMTLMISKTTSWVRCKSIILSPGSVMNEEGGGRFAFSAICGFGFYRSLIMSRPIVDVQLARDFLSIALAYACDLFASSKTICAVVDILWGMLIWQRSIYQ